MQKVYIFTMLILVGVIVISFFLPWISVESEPIDLITKPVDLIAKPLDFITNTLTGETESKTESSGTFFSISAFKVPILANSAEVRLMISIIKIFNPGIQGADKKSYLIWSIPGLAVIIFVMSLFLSRNRWFNLAVGILGITIFSVAAFKITTTNLDKLVLKVTIDQGLWLTLYGFLGMGILCALRFVQILIGRKRSLNHGSPVPSSVQ